MNAPVVAVIDSDAAYLHLMQDVLGDVGLEAVLADSSTDGYEIIRARPPDLLIIDSWLEHRGAGLALLRQLLRDGWTARLPIILTSTDDWLLVEDADLIGEVGCDAVAKPFDLERMLALIDRRLPPQRCHASATAV